VVPTALLGRLELGCVRIDAGLLAEHESAAGLWIGELRHPVRAHALRELEHRLLRLRLLRRGRSPAVREQLPTRLRGGPRLARVPIAPHLAVGVAAAGDQESTLAVGVRKVAHAVPAHARRVRPRTAGARGARGPRARPAAGRAELRNARTRRAPARRAE